MSVNDPYFYSASTCVKVRNNSSIESGLFNSSDFGEFYTRTSESHFHPCVTPVYNGKLLHIPPHIIHASLSGISIKHYYGKCFPEEEQEVRADATYPNADLYEDIQTEAYDYDWYAPEETDVFLGEKESFPFEQKGPKAKHAESKSQVSSSLADSSESYNIRKPICARFKINYRNSFWNIHRPELCKLTWPNRYVSSTTVTEHLHQHLLNHGPFCAEFHGDKALQTMLNNELDEYVRLKEILAPRALPPEENFADPKAPNNQNRFSKCRAFTMRDRLHAAAEKHSRNFPALKEAPSLERNLHRSREEFCLTIGKSLRKPAFTTPQSLSEEGYVTPYVPSSVEEGAEVYSAWDLYPTEQPFEEVYESIDESTLELEPIPLVDPCPPLMLDDFCRGIGKLDYSDLRCNPDDF